MNSHTIESSRPWDRRRPSRRWPIGALPLVLVAAAGSFAADLKVSLSSPVSYGEPVALVVEVANPDATTGHPRALAAVDGLKVEGPFGPQISQSMTIVNGRTEARSSRVYQYTVQPASGRTGSFALGPVIVPQRGADPLRSDTIQLGVYRRPDAGLRVTASLSAADGPVGRPVRVVYSLQFPSEESSELPLKDLEFPLLSQSGLRVAPVAAVDGKPAKSLRLGPTELPFQEGFAAEADGTAFATLVFAFEVVPLRPGALDFGGARAKMALATGRTRVQRDLFAGTVRVAERQMFEGSAPSTPYTVHPLPSAGKPRGFTGAVGRYKITATTKDTEVDAFSRIEVEIAVSGDGIDADLPAPAWHELEALTRSFEVSKDVDAGKLDEGRKVFHQVLRPLSDKVTEIPAFPFPYYDPWKAQYEVAYASAIPITVRAARNVGAAEAIVAVVREPVQRSAEAAVAAVVDASGIPANATEMGPLGPSDYRRRLLAPLFLAALAAPPAVFFLVLALLGRRKRDPARVARAEAMRIAARSLAAAGTDVEAVSRALQGYLHDRLRLPPGEITPAELDRELALRGAGDEVRSRAKDLLADLLAQRFSGSSPAAAALTARSSELLRSLERLRIE